MYRITRTAVLTGAGCAVAVSVYPHRNAGEVKDGLFTALYKNLAWPIIRNIPPEDAHDLSVAAAEKYLVPYDRVPDDASLKASFLGLSLRNPLGLAAGVDHNAKGVKGFDKMGFGFVEVGSVTPQPQQGTSKPRIFRLEADKGVINRVGYANAGAARVAESLKGLREGGYKGVVGVNLAMNRGSAPSEDFSAGIKALGQHADYLVINAAQLYHPPLPDFRSAKHPSALEHVLKAAVATKSKECPTVPLLVKIHPDFPDSELKSVCQSIKSAGIDGIIIAAPSAQRPDSLDSDDKNTHEFGGLSGAPIKDLANESLKKVYRHTNGQLPLIGVGGISSGRDAYNRVRAGASLVQMYTGLAYEGPYVVPRIKWEMERLAKEDGFGTVQEAVGADVVTNNQSHATGTDLTHRFSAWFFSPDGGVD